MTRILITLLIGAIGGLTGYFLRLPAGVLVGSMLAVGLCNCFGGRLGFQAYMPAKVRIGGQILIGCLLGLNLNPNTIMELRTIWAPALAIVVILLVSGCFTGFMVHKICKIDLCTAILSSSAGGLTELSVLAASLGVDGPKVAIIHLIRIITVITTMPLILTVLERILLNGN